MDEEVTKKRFLDNPFARYVVIAGVAFLIGAAAGFIPIWLSARKHTDRLHAAERELQFSRIQTALASAAIDARRGDYEPARQAASEFFTVLRAEADRGAQSSLSQTQREAVEPLFAQRDNIITLLARSDPAAADRLSDAYAAYRKVLQQ